MLHIRLVAVERGGKTICVRNGQLQLLMGCGLCSQQSLLALAFQPRPLDVRLNCRNSGLCGIDSGCCLHYNCLGVLNLAVLNSFCCLIVFEGCPCAAQGRIRFFKSCAIVLVVKLHKELAGLHRRKILNLDLPHGSGDARA
jgi:hypothetical protein